MNSTSNKHYTKEYLIYILLLLPAILMLIWRLPFGTGNTDEPLYLTHADRILKGDIPFFHEWHLSQICGIFLAPILYVYRLFFETTEGILVNFRYIWLFFHAATSISIFFLLKEKPYARIIASLFYLLYIPHAIPALCYNTIGLGAITLFFLLLTTKAAPSRLRCSIAGIFFAISVLAIPHHLILYSFFLLITLTFYILKKKRNFSVPHLFSPKTWVYVTLSCIITAIMYLLLIFSKLSLSDFLTNLKYILGDTVHIISPFTKIVTFFSSLLKIYNIFLLFWLALIIIACFDKSREKHSKIYILLMGLSITSYNIFLCYLQYSNFIMLPIIFLGLLIFILTPKKDYSTFIFIFGGGLLSSFCKHMSSELLVDAIAMNTVPLGIYTIIYCFDYITEIKKSILSSCKHISLCLLSFLVIQLSAEVYMDMSTSGFGVQIFDKTNVTINAGPLKGVIIPNERAMTETKTLEDIQFIKNKEPKKILFITNRTWLYLYADMEYATPSAFSYFMPNYWLAEYVPDYFNLHPDKIPDYIYASDGEGWDYDYKSIAQKYGYTLTYTNRGCFLEK